MGKIEFDDPTFRKSVDTLHDEGMKLGGRSVLNAKVKELIRELEELRSAFNDMNTTVALGLMKIQVELEAERKRSARWKEAAKSYHESYYTLDEYVTELLEVKQ
jgi:hypothetical protein